MTETPPPPLDCGTEPRQLLAQVGDGHSRDLTDHQAGCSHCREALERYQQLWAPFEVLAAETVRAPRGMATRAIAWIRAVHDDATATLLPITGLSAGPPGTSSVTTRVVIRSTRIAAEQVDGVRLALSELSSTPAAAHGDPDQDPDGPPATAATPDDTVLTLTVAADYGHDLHALAHRVRDAARGAVHELTGRTPNSVDVVIDDILPR